MIAHPRLSPDGFVAQHTGRDINGHGPWILLSWDDESGLKLEALDDEDVADWPELVPST